MRRTRTLFLVVLAGLFLTVFSVTATLASEDSDNERGEDSDRDSVVIEWGQPPEEEEDRHEPPDEDAPLWRRILPERDEDDPDPDAEPHYRQGDISLRVTGWLTAHSTLWIDFWSDNDDWGDPSYEVEDMAVVGIGVHGNYYLSARWALGAGLVYYPGPAPDLDPPNLFNSGGFGVIALPLEALYRFNQRTAITFGIGPTWLLYDEELSGIDYDDIPVAPVDADVDLERQQRLLMLSIGVQVNRVWVGLAFALASVEYDGDDRFATDSHGRDESGFIDVYEIHSEVLALGVGYVF